MKEVLKALRSRPPEHIKVSVNYDWFRERFKGKGLLTQKVDNLFKELEKEVKMINKLGDFYLHWGPREILLMILTAMCWGASYLLLGWKGFVGVALFVFGWALLDIFCEKGKKKDD